jgi:hypothetical protein
MHSAVKSIKENPFFLFSLIFALLQLKGCLASRYKREAERKAEIIPIERSRLDGGLKPHNNAARLQASQSVASFRHLIRIIPA